MDPYFPIIATQNLLLCLGVTCFIYRSTVLEHREKLGFYLTTWAGMAIALCELLATMLNGNPKTIWLHHFFVLINLGLTPLLPAIPLLTIGRSRKARMISLIPVFLPLVLLLSGHLYSIDSRGIYQRDPHFWIFMGCYLFNMVFLTYRSFVFSNLYQNHNAICLLFICLFMISSTTIQLRLPQIHFSWFCVTVTTLLYFIYYADTVHKKHSLTDLLNRNAYQADSLRLRRKLSGVVLIDMDDFKQINDTYGHLQGDQYLTSFAHNLRAVCGKTGYCYRLGGDEFCVLRDKIQDLPELQTQVEQLEALCASQQGLPAPIRFSWGFQELAGNMTVAEAMELADRKMYASKAERKMNHEK